MNTTGGGGIYFFGNETPAARTERVGARQLGILVSYYPHPAAQRRDPTQFRKEQVNDASL